MHDHELTREALAHLPTDIAASPLFNGDLAPTPLARRNWTTYNFAALWVAMAHCIPTYLLAGGLIAVGMNWWQALLTIGIGNIIVLIPILLNAHPGTKYGIPFPVLVRSSFGTVGANVPAILRALVACGWFGIQIQIGGEAIKLFLTVIWPEFSTFGGETMVLGLNLPSFITFIIFWLMNMGIVLIGMNAVRTLENWSAPLILIMALWLLWWMVGRAGGLGQMLERPSTFSTGSQFWKVFIPSLTGMIGFWATLSLNIPDFTRFGRRQKQQMIGQTLGLPTTMVAFSAMALIITSAAETILKKTDPKLLWDPIFVLSQITSAKAPQGLIEPLILDSTTRTFVAFACLLGVAIATISTNIAANVISPANDFANFAPRIISFKTGAIITGVIGMLIMPWKLLKSPDSYIFSWLVGYSALLGPIAGIMIVDYWVLRRCKLDAPDLYRHSGRYGGINWVAMIALVIGIAPNLPGFLKSVSLIQGAPNFWDEIYPYAWFTGLFLAGLIHMLFSPTKHDKMKYFGINALK